MLVDSGVMRSYLGRQFREKFGDEISDTSLPWNRKKILGYRKFRCKVSIQATNWIFEACDMYEKRTWNMADGQLRSFDRGERGHKVAKMEAITGITELTVETAKPLKMLLDEMIPEGDTQLGCIHSAKYSIDE